MAKSDLHIGITADAQGVEKGFKNAVTHTKNLKKDIAQLNREIQEQKGITVEFQNELNRLREKLAKTAATDIKQTRALKKEIEGLTTAIKDNKAGVANLSTQKAALNQKLKDTKTQAGLVSTSFMRMNETARSALPSMGGLIAGFTGMSVAMLVADGVMMLADSLFHFNKVAAETDDFAFKASMKPVMDEMNAALKVSEDFADARQRVNNSFDEGTKEIQKEVTAVSLYYKVATDLNQTYKNRHTALKNLQSIAPDYFNSFDTETILTQNATDAYKLYNKEAAKRIQIAGLISQANAAGIEQAKAQGELLARFGKQAQSLDFSQKIKVSDLEAAGINVDNFTEAIWGQIDAFNYWQGEVNKMVSQASKIGGAIESIAPSASTPKGKKEKEDKTILINAETDAISRRNLAIEYYLSLTEEQKVALNDPVFSTAITSQNDLTKGAEAFIPVKEEEINTWLAYVDALKKADAAAKKLSTEQENLKAFAQGVAGAFDALGSAMADSMIDGLGTAATAMDVFKSEILATIIKLFGMAMANAIAGATASGAALGPAAIFATPAFIATAMGGVTSAFAAAASFKPKGFASGGVIGGNSLTGDKLLAPVNSKEVVLNTGQQNDLMRMLDGGGGSGRLEHRIEGTDLVIWYNRAIKANGRG